jgi:hypothetical protein
MRRKEVIVDGRSDSEPVVFRKWRDKDGGIIAIFPCIATDSTGGKCQMYEHIGQHGGGYPQGVIKATVLASEKEYKALRYELQVQRGYKLKVYSRIQRWMHRQRMKEARGG